MSKRDYQQKFRSCFENAQDAQQTYQFPLALRLYRRCIRLGEKWQDRLSGYEAKGFVAVARLRYAETLMYCGSISKGAQLGLRTVKQLANALPAMKLPKSTLAHVREAMIWTETVCAQHEKELNCPLWILEPRLFEAVLHIISKHDPNGLVRPGDNLGAWTEFTSEVEAILPRLKSAACAADVEKIVRQGYRCSEFRSIATEIWRCIGRPEHKRSLANIVDVRTPIAKAVEQVRKLRPKHDDKLRRALIEALRREAGRLDIAAMQLRAILCGESP